MSYKSQIIKRQRVIKQINLARKRLIKEAENISELQNELALLGDNVGDAIDHLGVALDVLEEI